MKIAGFTFIRNAIKFDYPVVEAITSVLPLCDEFVVALGNSEDGTEELIQSIGSQKIKIIQTVWDDSLREGGKVLAEETNKALAAISEDVDWAFYIQGDEALHEQYIGTVYDAMLAHKDDPKVDGLLFKYLHFFGSYDYVGDSSRWYRHEIRVIRKRKDIYSYRDAQGFRKGKDEKLSVKAIDAYIFHYGWVKDPVKQQAKVENFNKLWHSDQWMQKNITPKSFYDYHNIESLARFEGTHPTCMRERISRQDWEFSFDTSQKNLNFKHRIKYWVEKLTGWRPGEYKNYEKI